MLLAVSARRTVVVLPLLLFAFALGFGAVALSSFLHHASWAVVICSGLVSGFVLWLAFDGLALVSVEADKLRLRGPFRRGELKAEACVFGVRLQPGSRSTRYIVFATDAQANFDVADWATERGARRGVERLQWGLYGTMARSPSNRAEREVAEVEGAWKASAAEAQKSIDNYYQSPAWRRGKYLVMGLVAAYSIGMMFYEYFRAKP